MRHAEHEPIPPIDTATDPVASAADLRQRWRALMGPLGFGEKLLWIGFLGPDRRLVKTMSQLPIGPRPRAAILKNLMSALRTLLDDMAPGSTVALLLTGPRRRTGLVDRPGVVEVVDRDGRTIRRTSRADFPRQRRIAPAGRACLTRGHLLTETMRPQGSLYVR